MEDLREYPVVFDQTKDVMPIEIAKLRIGHLADIATICEVVAVPIHETPVEESNHV